MKEDTQMMQWRLNRFLNKITTENKAYFACVYPLNANLAYHVNFFRIEIVLSGSIKMLITTKRNKQMTIKMNPYDSICIPINGWNHPIWEKPVQTLSLLFDKQTIGLSYVHWNGSQFSHVEKQQISQHNDRLSSLIINNLMELNDFLYNQNTMRYLVQALISDVINTANNQKIEFKSARPSLLCQQVKRYVDANYHLAITRNSVASHFNISANYLSHIFFSESNIKFTNYLNYIRLKEAKKKLLNENMNINIISSYCGFRSVNYFCRLFKQHFGISPSSYRSRASDK